jgi:chemotaxis signal transduction protein
VLTLAFKIGADQYALPSTAIEEAIALVNLRALPDAPAGIVGDFNYHGRMVPAIDLSELVLKRPSNRRWSTRILLTHLDDTGTSGKLIGLISENATELIVVADDVDDVKPPRLLQLKTLLDQGTHAYLLAHETEPQADWRPVDEEPEFDESHPSLALTIRDQAVRPTSGEAAIPKPIRTKRAPRLSYFDDK